MSPGSDAARHSPAFRATQYLYASDGVSLNASPVAALLTSNRGCVPQNAHVGSGLRFNTPRNPDDPPRSSEPLAANAPAVTPQDHIGVEPCGCPLPVPTGQLSD